MPECAVVNTSPLIFLGPAGLLDLLKQDVTEVVFPEPVWEEIHQAGDTDATVKAIVACSWLRKVQVIEIAERVLRWDLGRGESAVLTWALANPPARVVIDDLAGRRCARALGLDLMGTLGLVLRSRQRGQIRSARDVLLALRSKGMYLSDKVLAGALARVGEVL